MPATKVWRTDGRTDGGRFIVRRPNKNVGSRISRDRIRGLTLYYTDYDDWVIMYQPKNAITLTDKTKYESPSKNEPYWSFGTATGAKFYKTKMQNTNYKKKGGGGRRGGVGKGRSVKNSRLAWRKILSTALLESGLNFNNCPHARGHVHIIVVTCKKLSLQAHGPNILLQMPLWALGKLNDFVGK